MRIWIAAVLSAALIGMGARAQSPQPQIPSLLVNGESEVRVRPDVAVVRLGVTRQSETAQRAQNLVNEAANAVEKAVLALGIGPTNVQTSSLNLSPIYQQQRPGSDEEPKVLAYRGNNSVSVRVKDLKLVGKVLDAALSAGANVIQGVSFDLEEDREARSRALAQAVKSAKEKADVVAAALGVKLVGVLEVQEGGVRIQPPVYAGARMMTMAGRGAAAETSVSPGEVTISASVTIRYRLP